MNELSSPTPQSGWTTVVNENLAAGAAALMYARNYATSTGLVLGYFGGQLAGSAIADGTTTLAASQANVYVVAHRTTGAVTNATNTTNWDATGTYGRVGRGVTSGSAITTWEDWRFQVGGWFDKAAGGSGGTVTSVAASVPAFLSVSGSPVTTTGTLVIGYSGTALPVANGGTGITAFGTGVATALGVNVGSAGAFVVNGGALGTPSSGTLTNATGLPAAAVTYTPGVLADWDGAADPGDLDDALDQLAERVADVEAAGAGPSVASRYVIDLASQSDGDPGSGKLRFNHATPTSATKIFLDDETSDGVDLSTALLDLGSSGYIRIQSVADVGEWLVAKWTAIVDDTGYFDIAITVLASKGTLDDTDAVLVTFDAKGTGGSTQGRHSIFVAAGAMTPASSAGATAGSALTQGGGANPEIGRYLSFDPTTQQYAHFMLAMPKSWNEGTVTFQPYWQHGAAASFGVVWHLAALARNDGDSVSASTGTAQASADTGGTTDDLYIGPESSAITIAGSPATGCMVFFRITRVTGDAGDDLDVAARLLGIMLHVTTDADTDA
jgi:hypothetical protein